MTMMKFSTCLSAITVMLIFLQNHLVASLSPIHQKTALFHFIQSLTIGTPSICYYYSYFESYEIPSYPKTMNWSMSSDHCTWEGVSCEHQTGDVIGLDLSCSQLEGAILPNSTLFQLSHLHFLNLSNNNFSLSNQFPQEFGSFAKGLTHLNLSNTGFSGSVPSGISHLYKLVSLDLSDNYFPKLENEAFKSVIQNLTQLRVLNLYWVNISSVLPVNLSTSLRVLNLRNTWFSGRVPSGISHLYKLVSLDLSDNYDPKLDDEVFKSLLQNLTQLRVLDLHRVNISSVFPVNLSTSLRVLDLEYTGLHGVLPQEVFHLPNMEVLALTGSNSYGEETGLEAVLPKVKWGSSGTLQHLILDGINFNGGGIPDSIGFLESLASLRLYECNLSGPIPRSIGNLGQLTYLGLDGNNLNGPIPTVLTNLTNLRYLYLSNNNFTGPLPVNLSTSLRVLDLSDTGIHGVLPQEVFHLPNIEELILGGTNLGSIWLQAVLPKVKWGSSGTLQHLFLGRVDIYGGIPDSIGFLESLATLELIQCNLSGPIPKSLGNLGQLTSLGLGHNNLNGPIPTLLTNLTNLRYLSLNDNNFTGPLPSSVAHFKGLVELDLGGNGLTGLLPTGLFNHPSLEKLSLSYNGFTGQLYESNYSKSQLKHFDCRSNLLYGRIQQSLFQLVNLTYLDISNNEIEGEILHSIGWMRWRYLNLSYNRLTGGIEQLPWNKILYLDLQSNKLNGSLPTLICNSSFLRILNLSNNTLSGVLPICQTNLTSLLVFDLRMNKIQGHIPAALSNFRNLQTLNLNGNKLEGRIPSSFVQFDRLRVLDLGNNQISDTFPQCLEALPHLQVLVLTSNKFHGLINKSSTIECPFPSLRIIDLSYNEFSGPLPAMYFQNFNAMMIGDVNEREDTYIETKLDTTSYSDSTILVIKGVEIQFVRILTVLTTIDLSRNNFEGEIPEYIGKLILLRYLNLSHNHLTGHIPSSIGNLSVLESLDLSSNQLEGEIPRQLTSINTLARLNLSCNQLDGQIPKGSQFNTFDNDSYVGNIGLCGFPLSKECEPDIEMQKEGEDDDYFFSGFTWEAVVIGYGCGVVPAFIIGNLMLLAGKPKWFAGIIARELGLKIRRMEIRMR